MIIPARLGIVTLGVADLARSAAFYEALGWQRCSASSDRISRWTPTGDCTSPDSATGHDQRGLD